MGGEYPKLVYRSKTDYVRVTDAAHEAAVREAWGETPVAEASPEPALPAPPRRGRPPKAATPQEAA